MAPRKDTIIALITPFLVHNDSSKLDRQKTIEKFSKVVDDVLLKNEADDAAILSCLNDLFDHFKGARLNQIAIEGEVFRRMKNYDSQFADPGLFPGVAKRTLAVLKNEIEAGRFATKAGSGTWRVVDQERPKTG